MAAGRVLSGWRRSGAIGPAGLPPGTEEELLTAVAVAGPAAVPDPLLRAVLRGPRR